MKRVDLNNLRSFVMVARERSFTRAAAQLGVSQSALSHTIRGLEAKLGIRLLTRTTRGVSPTEAGERLLATVAPHYEGIEEGLAAVTALHDKPMGTVRITAHDHAIETVIWPRLARFLADYPDIKVELNVNYGFVDIVAERFDAGVRSGDQVARDMIAVRIGPPVKMAVVGAPSYFLRRPAPRTPRDLAGHECINLRLPTHGALYAWDFEQNGQSLKVHVEGQCVFNTTSHMLGAASAGLGLAYVPQDIAVSQVAVGSLTRVLESYCPTWPGYHLYFPSRRQSLPAFALLVDALRFREQ
jgi:DNA-binding transcriptional LysR family regulator